MKTNINQFYPRNCYGGGSSPRLESRRLWERFTYSSGLKEAPIMQVHLQPPASRPLSAAGFCLRPCRACSDADDLEQGQWAQAGVQLLPSRKVWTLPSLNARETALALGPDSNRLDKPVTRVSSSTSLQNPQIRKAGARCGTGSTGGGYLGGWQGQAVFRF